MNMHQNSQSIHENSKKILWHEFLKLNSITSIKGYHQAEEELGKEIRQGEEKNVGSQNSRKIRIKTITEVKMKRSKREKKHMGEK